jgi:ribose/xylose/arabinose/galactoside ABC-type transport system permease subunit
MFGLSTIKLALIGIAFVAIIGAIGGTYIYVKHLQSEVSTLTSQNVALTQANAIDAQNIQVSNSAVNALKAQDATNSANAAKAVADAILVAKAKQAQINQLLAQKSSGNTAEDCSSLNSNFDSFIGDNQ